MAPGLDSDDDDEEEDVPDGGGGIQPGLQNLSIHVCSGEAFRFLRFLMISFDFL